MEGVRFENVDFHYPGTARTILRGFNLSLKTGEIAAIVGENGEGKTTLVKLLCRFYDPEKGRIAADGSDLRDLRKAEWRRQITVLFQEPVRSLAAGCTVLIISHRLAMTMQADVIHVMGGGRIIESGTHADLMTLGGRYREAWESSHADAG